MPKSEKKTKIEEKEVITNTCVYRPQKLEDQVDQVLFDQNKVFKQEKIGKLSHSALVCLLEELWLEDDKVKHLIADKFREKREA